MLKRVALSQCQRSSAINKIIVILIITSVSFSLNGCQNRNSIWFKGLSAPFSVVYHSVPFATGNSVWDEAELIEKDTYGRELYLYTVSPDTYLPARDLGSTTINFYTLVICQKTEYEKVYFYEDQCYLILLSKDYSDDNLQAIKTANDWNKPLDNNKMISVADTFEQNTSVDQEKCVESFCNTVNVDENHRLVFDEVSVKNSESLCVIREFYTEETGKRSKKYFFVKNFIALFSEDNELIKYTSFDGTFEKFQDQIVQFKKTKTD